MPSARFRRNSTRHTRTTAVTLRLDEAVQARGPGNRARRGAAFGVGARLVPKTVVLFPNHLVEVCDHALDDLAGALRDGVHCRTACAHQCQNMSPTHRVGIAKHLRLRLDQNQERVEVVRLCLSLRLTRGTSRRLGWSAEQLAQAPTPR